MEKIIEEEKNLKDWTEVAMQRLFQSGELSFQAIDINRMPWVEIDNYDDLAQSDKIFAQLDKSILDYKHMILDLDGTIFVGDQLVPGVVNAIEKLKTARRILQRHPETCPPPPKSPIHKRSLTPSNVGIRLFFFRQSVFGGPGSGFEKFIRGAA